MADNSNKGFASPTMDPQKKHDIQSKGGQSQGQDDNSGNFANRSEEDVKEAGSKGGKSQSEDTNSDMSSDQSEDTQSDDMTE